MLSIALRKSRGETRTTFLKSSSSALVALNLRLFKPAFMQSSTTLGLARLPFVVKNTYGVSRSSLKPTNSGDQPLGIDKTLTDVERCDLDHASLTHLASYTLKQIPVEVRRRILAELKCAECATIVAALRKLYLD